jgi:NhaA family Na+:H+ antiporter
LALKVFLAALAIVDDIGAVLVIALFYTAEISWTALVWAAGLLVLLTLANWSGVRRPAAFALLGIALWLAVLESGLHATVAGVLLAMTIPARTRMDAAEFVGRGRRALDEFERARTEGDSVLTNESQQAALQEIETLCEAAQAPLVKLEHKLHPMVAFGIMPLFALANAGVGIESDVGRVIADPISLGVLLGLVLGKPIGITLLAWLAVRVGVATRLEGVPWSAVHAVSWLAGIGFTMSLFIASLALPAEEALTAAKVGILGASTLAGLIGWVLMRAATRRLAEHID